MQQLVVVSFDTYNNCAALTGMVLPSLGAGEIRFKELTKQNNVSKELGEQT